MSDHDIPDRVQPGADASWLIDSPPSLGSFVPDGVNDRLVHLCFELAAQLWVVRRRLAAIEGQLVESDTITSPDQLPSEFDAQERRERDAFIERIFASFRPV